MLANIGREELKAKIDRGDPFILLEVLGPQYYRHSHLPGAQNLPPGKVDEMASTLVPDKNAEIVLYCWDEEWPTSEQAARELAAMGYTNVRDYVEGKQAWVAAGLPVEGRSRRARRRGGAEGVTGWMLPHEPDQRSARADAAAVTRMQEVIQIMEERNERGTVMVTGATGQQGGAVARHLLETGFGVRALVRDLQKPRAKVLAERGIELVQGDLDDCSSSERVLYGSYGVFSM